ncbi:hypothetical protein EPK99_01190 [Neorhizobium lilium]|uniref:Uncharacterized protein n=1 Tax=Neorhizobium lilium TaxID=2503024 RepID=A0A444LKY3_9HYPH|nr:hypothetical protein EPK99_01190 [Neorhizobium lilium]
MRCPPKAVDGGAKAADHRAEFRTWLIGSLSGVRWPNVYLAGPVAIAVSCSVCCMLFARALDAFTLGTDAAQHHGGENCRTLPPGSILPFARLSSPCASSAPCG